MADFKHRAKIRVLYGDTDAAAVVYNANYLRYFEYGRTEFMREHVCTYRQIEEMGIVLPVTECYTRYKAPAFYDDLITIESRISELSKLKCKFEYRILREENGKEKLLAKGFTVHVAVNKSGKLTRLPDDILTKMEKFAPDKE